jgi:hypothetical protein
MTEQARHNIRELFKVGLSLLGGAILTLMLSTMNETRSNTERIARLEAVVEPLKTVSADIAWLKATADRNVQSLDRIEKKIDEHVTEKK